MKSDMSRVTFERTRHYKRVPLQQGRVQTDADANEQQAIAQHRVETEALDLIGGCGGPLHAAGFGITPDGDDLRVGAGRYYVHGVLCENEEEVGYAEQPDYPLDPAWLAGLADPPLTLPPADGAYLAYLDVWERHLTALEAPWIREVALGGPDTATRIKTVWQVKLHALEAGDPDPGDLDCLSDVPSWAAATAPSTGELGARSEAGSPSDDPCIVTPGAGYRRLENQLYRVEVHAGGPRNDSIFKWDRDNGTVLARLEAQNGTLDEWTVSSVGRDDVLRFAPGDLVELTDDGRELHGRAGTLVRVTSVEGKVVTVDPATVIPAGGSLDMADFPDNPKVRRWNGVLDGVTNQDWRDLEDGVQVQLRGGNGPDGEPRRYRVGDWWTIPARTNTGDVEWPAENDGWRPAAGTRHDYCRLAVLEYAGGAGWSEPEDCRNLFPPVTELTHLHYAGGDGQECMPGQELPLSLRVGVANGSHPVEGARVRFTVASGGAEIAEASGGAGQAELEVATGPDGQAECFWSPAADPLSVDAALLDAAGDPVPHTVRFGANLSTADQVAYTPADGCAMPDSVDTVQEALDALCAREGSGCAVTIGPGDDWRERAEAALEAADDLHLCFRAGSYVLDAPLAVQGKGHVSITGCGPATRFRAQGTETVFAAEGCRSIRFADFRAEADFAGDLRDDEAAEHLRGVLDVVDCDAATVERISARCAGGVRRAVAGITVRERKPGRLDGRHSVRVRGCDVAVGHRQTGILVVNADRALVEDNRIWVTGRPEGLGVADHAAADGHLRTVLAEALLGQPEVGLRVGTRFPLTEMRRRLLRAGLTQDAGEVRTRVTLGERTFTLSFFTPVDVVQIWPAVLEEHPVETGSTAASVEQHLHTLTNRLLQGRLQGGRASRDLAEWVERVVARMPAVASQGIVVAKNEAPEGAPPAPDLRVLNNRVEGCQQGLHLGASHGTAGQDLPECAHDALDTVLVQGNAVDVVLSPETSRERHGIFVGNARHLTVQDNRVRVRRTQAGGVWRVDGIRAWGFFGPLVLLRQNLTEGADVGIRMVPGGADQCWPSVRHWYISDNAAVGAEPGVEAPSSVVQERNRS